MIVKSLRKMERIVESHPNLEWNGWDVEWYKPYPAGFLKSNGAFHNGRWTLLTKFSPERNGWSIPAGLARGRG